MKLELKESPRSFVVGIDGGIEIKDMGSVYLAPNEQLTFVTDEGARFDFVRKSWGYYATPSINGRLVQEGFKTALVENEAGRIYVLVIEAGMMQHFEEYCRIEGQKILQWLNEHQLKGE
jgi:RNase P/RNase MRP subunit p29